MLNSWVLDWFVIFNLATLGVGVLGLLIGLIRRNGPAPVLFRSRAHVRRPFVRRPLVISSRGLNVSGAGCRSR